MPYIERLITSPPGKAWESLKVSERDWKITLASFPHQTTKYEPNNGLSWWNEHSAIRSVVLFCVVSQLTQHLSRLMTGQKDLHVRVFFFSLDIPYVCTNLGRTNFRIYAPFKWNELHTAPRLDFFHALGGFKALFSDVFFFLMSICRFCVVVFICVVLVVWLSECEYCKKYCVVWPGYYLIWCGHGSIMVVNSVSSPGVGLTHILLSHCSH